MVEDLAFERKLYVVRRLVEKAVSRSAIPSRGDFYIPSLSCRTIVYKGMLNASQLRTFYPDLLDERVESAIAMVHSRFSTNTFPSWARAHPYRYISHNGEINTLRGNVNWMHARQSQFRSHAVRRRTDQGPAGHRHGRLRLGHPGQRPRAAVPVRPLPGRTP